MRARYRPIVAGTCLLLVAGGCEGDPADGAKNEDLVLAPLTQLTFVAAEDDPLVSHRPEVIDCNTLVGWTIEEGLLEVNTAACNYLSLSEPAFVPAPSGARVTTRISHFDLTAPEPAEAHLALFVKETLLWETRIAVPSSAEVLDVNVELPGDVAKGDPIGFHLHNHGQNTWNIEPLRVTSLPL